MTFEEIIVKLREGKVVRRNIWREELVIFMQIPAFIECEKTWNMQSLPGDMKVLLKQNNFSISYKDQFIIYDANDNSATYTIFDGEDVNATDWEVIDPFTYSVYE